MGQLDEDEVLLSYKKITQQLLNNKFLWFLILKIWFFINLTKLAKIIMSEILT
jgi:hypothetical protein